MDKPLISIVIPVFNSSKNLKKFLQSCVNARLKNAEIVINDSPDTSDDTRSLVESFSDKLHLVYKCENFSMAQGRLKGSEYATSDILLHLDSDMQLTSGLVEECLDKINSGYDALVIPEESFGATFWARCKWLEKKCYEGEEKIESLRCLKTSIYNEVGGHNPHMVFSEDKDLDLKVKTVTRKIDRTTHYLLHDEGELRLMSTLKKKIKYSNTANLFAIEHPVEFKWQVNIFNRYYIFLRNGRYFFKYPYVYVGMIFMKTCEFLAGFVGIVRSKI